MLGLDDLDGSGFAMGDEADAVVERIEAVLATHGRDHWLVLAEEHGLPLSAVHSGGEAGTDPVFADAGLTEEQPMPGGEAMQGVGPWLPEIGRTPDRPAPALGEHTEAILEEHDDPK